MCNVSTRPTTPARHRAMLDRATAKSDEQARAGNLPRLVRRNAYEAVWAVGSRTEGGVVWLVTEAKDGQLCCDCPAETTCWHEAHVSRALAGRIGCVQVPAWPRPVIDPASIYGRRVG